MSTMTVVEQRPVGDVLRWWRQHRRRSQLDLALETGISAKHLSFVENGRSRPSSDVILRLAESLNLPLRERNRLLLAGGFAPVFHETGLDDPQFASIRSALRQVLTGHEPYPAIVVDRLWNLVDANAGLAHFVGGVAPDLLEPPVNVLRFTLHPEGAAPNIVNLGEVRGHLLGRIRRQMRHTADPELSKLYDELMGYPSDQAEPEVEYPGPGEIVLPIKVRKGDQILSFFSTVATFGSPLDITLSELAIESFFPADDATAEVLRATQ